MQLLPAIDLLDGQVVRLAQGSYADVTKYHFDPLEQALSFKEQGATWIHVVDLNGARSGDGSNLKSIAKLITESGLKVELGGGIRSMQTIERLVDLGVQRLVIGSKLLTDPEFAQEALRAYGELICAGVDCREGLVAIHGWEEQSSVSDSELIARLKDWGMRHLVYTDIARDGMQTGIDPRTYSRIAGLTGFPVVASGGVSTLADIRGLVALGDATVEAIIVGRAIYEGSLSVRDAIGAINAHECA